MMIGIGTRDMRGARDDGRGLPYRIASEDWFGSWTTASGGFTIQAQGTEGDDVVTGTDADERYLGLGGNDTISGAGGRDHLFGNDGSDTIDGGGGDDVIFGGDNESRGTGQDTIQGGAGNDTITSDLDGGDVIYGEKGNDSISTADGNVLYGGGGDDSISGGNSDIFGGAGDDQLLGIGSMRGGAGNDRLEIGFPFVPSEHGHDVWGGSGADNFLLEMPSGYIGGGELVIHDLTNEDMIDLSGIDARFGLSGDQAFTLVPEFDGQPGTMTITYDAAHDRTLIELHTDPNDIVDGTIVVPGDHTDFINFVF